MANWSYKTSWDIFAISKAENILYNFVTCSLIRNKRQNGPNHKSGVYQSELMKGLHNGDIHYNFYSFFCVSCSLFTARTLFSLPRFPREYVITSTVCCALKTEILLTAEKAPFRLVPAQNLNSVKPGWGSSGVYRARKAGTMKSCLQRRLVYTLEVCGSR